VTHFFARLEIWNTLGLHVHRLARTRITADATVTGACGEGAEAAQLDATTLCKTLGNGVENARHDLLYLARGKARLVLVHESDEFGPDH